LFQYYCSYWNIVHFAILLFVLYYCSLFNIIGQIEKLFVSILLFILNYCSLFNIIVHIELLFVFNIIVHIALLLCSVLLLSIILNIFQYYWNQKYWKDQSCTMTNNIESTQYAKVSILLKKYWKISCSIKQSFNNTEKRVAQHDQ